jgi:hypothetical protein
LNAHALASRLYVPRAWRHGSERRRRTGPSVALRRMPWGILRCRRPAHQRVPLQALAVGCLQAHDRLAAEARLHSCVQAGSFATEYTYRLAVAAHTPAHPEPDSAAAHTMGLRLELDGAAELTARTWRTNDSVVESGSAVAVSSAVRTTSLRAVWCSPCFFVRMTGGYPADVCTADGVLHVLPVLEHGGRDPAAVSAVPPERSDLPGFRLNSPARRISAVGITAATAQPACGADDDRQGPMRAMAAHGPHSPSCTVLCASRFTCRGTHAVPHALPR